MSWATTITLQSFFWKWRLFGLSIERPILDHHPKAHIHEIRRISGEIWRISWNPWNPADFTLEIWWISPWNLVDFTQISPVKSTQNYIKASVSAKTLQFDECRVGDFTQIWPVKSTQNYKSKCFSKNSSVWWMQGGGFHPRNLVDFTHEIWWISPRFHLWNPPKIIKASVSAKTLQFDECRVGAMTKDFMKSTRFHPEIWWISPVKSSRVHPDFIYEIHPKL